MSTSLRPCASTRTVDTASIPATTNQHAAQRSLMARPSPGEESSGDGLSQNRAALDQDYPAGGEGDQGWGQFMRTNTKSPDSWPAYLIGAYSGTCRIWTRSATEATRNRRWPNSSWPGS